MNQFYTTSLIFTKSLKSLEGILKKIQQTENIDENKILQTSLAPDMFPLIRQIQIACDNAKGFAGRVSIKPAPSFEDKETSLLELIQRVQNTVLYMKSLQEEDFMEAEARRITLPWIPGKYATGFDYMTQFAIPNFYFHLVTAYGIIRHLGYQIGKGDYIGGIEMQEL